MRIGIPEPDKETAAIRHFPPESHGHGKGRAAVGRIDAHEQVVHVPVEKGHGACPGKAIHIILNACFRQRRLPHFLRQPAHGGLPLGRVKRGRLVHGKGGNFEATGLDGPKQILPPFRTILFPPVIHGQGDLRRPAEPGFFRRLFRSQNAVNGNIQITHLLLAAYCGMIGEADIRMRHMYDVHPLNMFRQFGFRCVGKCTGHKEYTHRQQNT
ncbi:MAG: hypothetical protein BWY09_00847 [Candidatus Hydrogenedentes bacterium ADurb.Bin179]|nr:MAG: hypothetical protein BWY09_00847 [Candidatus Hydrogenedentes bacterium ADurb.Bin179]